MGQDSTFGETNFNPKMKNEPYRLERPTEGGIIGTEMQATEKPFLTETYECKCNCNLDACANETCWDLQECQGTPLQKANARISELQSELSQWKEKAEKLQEERDGLRGSLDFLEKESVPINHIQTTVDETCIEFLEWALPRLYRADSHPSILLSEFKSRNKT